jgi:methylenetetrahydrofolate dehydrogenase (NADP+)/methenyltetrahydrofolate cyclohydrolase
MILNLIEPKKDIDCLTAFNLGYLILGKPIYLPATVLAIKKILVLAGINKNNIIGKNVCVVGKSSLVGKPLANLLTNMGATVTVCHRGTENISQFTSQAQILISATGQKGLISGKMVKKGAIVIDVGSPQPDCNFKSVAKKAKFVTPVPGGVGPMTVACLMENFIYCLESFSLKNQGG